MWMSQRHKIIMKIIQTFSSWKTYAQNLKELLLNVQTQQNLNKWPNKI